MDVRKLQELSELFCVATTLNNLLDHMLPEQAAFVLKVAEDANEATINRAYKKLAKIYNPDVATGSELKFKLLNKARRVMLDNVEPVENVINVDFEKMVNSPGAEKGHLLGNWFDRALKRK